MELLLVDDHVMLRDALASMLRQAMPAASIRYAGTGAEALSLAEQAEPDCVVLDFNMPGLDGLEVTKRLLERYPGLFIICLSVRTDITLIEELFSAGIRGYVLKDDDFDRLLEALRSVMAGQHYVSPCLQGLVELPVLGGNEKNSGLGYSALTARQRDVLARIASGLSIREISSDIGLSTKTLDAHRRRIQAKLGVDSVADLTRIAIREGLVTVEGDPVLPDTLLQTDHARN